MSDPAFIAARVARWEREGPQGPVTLELYPTLKCNLDCIFCDTTERHQPRTDELPLEKHLALLEEAAALGVRRVFVLGGGEPLVARDLTPPILRRVKELGMEGVLTTNGTILPPALLRQLLETGWDEIHVSIDGADAATHDRLRGVPGAFRKSIGNLCRLNVAKTAAGLELPRLALHFVITRLNYRALPDMVRLGHALGVSRIDFDGLIAYRPEQLALSLSEAERGEVPAIAERALRLAEGLGIATTLERFVAGEGLQRGSELPEAASGQGLAAAPCLKAWHYLVVQSDGRTSPCCVLAGEGGSLRETSLHEVWTRSPFLESVRAGMLKGEPLSRCRECSPNILEHERAIRALLPA